MKKILLGITVLAILLSLSFRVFATERPDALPGVNKLSDIGAKKQKRAFAGCDLGFTLGDYTEVRVSPLIGYRFSKYITGGLKFTYMHSWNKVNTGMTNQTTIQYDTYGGNAFMQYFPVPQFYLKAEYSYLQYKHSSTTGDLNEWVPFLFAGLGYSQYISPTVSFNVGIKVDILNNQKSPFADFTPFFDGGIAVDL